MPNRGNSFQCRMRRPKRGVYHDGEKTIPSTDADGDKRLAKPTSRNTTPEPALEHGDEIWRRRARRGSGDSMMAMHMRRGRIADEI